MKKNKACACSAPFQDRAGGGDWAPSSRSTVRTVRYTALSTVDVHRQAQLKSTDAAFTRYPCFIFWRQWDSNP